MKILFATATALLFTLSASAQTLALASPETKSRSVLLTAPRAADESSKKTGYNNEVKINLLSLAMFNFSFQYERALTPHLGAALGVRFGPERNLPFSGILENSVGGDTVGKRLVTDARLSNYAFTPEIRYYFGSRNISGFYLGLFGRFGKFSLNMPYSFTDENAPGGKQNVVLNGSYGYGGAGLQIGTKFNLSRRLTLDWALFGPMFTSGTLSLDANVDLSNLRAEDRAAAEESLRETFDNVQFTSNNISVSRALTLPGIRTAFSLGYRF